MTEFSVIDYLHDNAWWIALLYGVSAFASGELGAYHRRKYGRTFTLREMAGGLALMARRLIHGLR